MTIPSWEHTHTRVSRQAVRLRAESDLSAAWTSNTRQEEEGAAEGETVGWHHQLSVHKSKQTLGGRGAQGSLASCSPWGHKESDTTQQQNNRQQATAIMLTTFWESNAKFDLRDPCKHTLEESCLSNFRGTTKKLEVGGGVQCETSPDIGWLRGGSLPEGEELMRLEGNEMSSLPCPAQHCF